MSMTPQIQIQFQQNMKDLENIIAKLKRDIKIYKEENILWKNRYNKIMEEKNNYIYLNNNINISEDINYDEIITDYNLKLINKKEKGNTNNFYKIDIINKMYKDKYIKTLKIHQNNEELEKNNIINIKENTIFYNLKINIKNIPIIIVYHKYEKNNFSDCQLIPYFDINKYFSNLLLLFIKYNLSFNKQANTPKKNKNRNDYGKVDQNNEINSVLDRIHKSKKIGKRRYIDFYEIRVRENRCKLEKYNYYFINNSKFSDDEKYNFFEEEGITPSNESRFNKYTKIFYKFHNNKYIKDSDYIFLPNTFKDINYKSIDALIYKLEKFIKNPEKLEDIKNNVFDDDNQENIKYEEYINTCLFCDDLQNPENKRGMCDECYEQITKPQPPTDDDYY